MSNTWKTFSSNLPTETSRVCSRYKVGADGRLQTVAGIGTEVVKVFNPTEGVKFIDATTANPLIDSKNWLIIQSLIGQNWQARTAPTGFTHIRGLASNANTLLAINGPTTYKSTDGGQTWSGPFLVPDTFGDFEWNGGFPPITAIMWVGNQYLSVGDDGVTAYSVDGESWVLGSNGAFQSPAAASKPLIWNGETGASSIILMLAANNTISRTTDSGLSWTSIFLGQPLVDGGFRGGLFALNKFFVVGDGGVISSSTGLSGTWTKVLDILSALGVPMFDGTKITVTGINSWYSSTDGENWNSYTPVFNLTTALPLGQRFDDFVWINGSYVGFAKNLGRIVTSQDAITWTEQTGIAAAWSAGDQNIYSYVYDNSKLYIGGFSKLAVSE